ncbi:hypothetical protein JN652_001373 [Vibrio cholerae]|nr:hypothetical protein [Vibrio cholerae]
MKLKLISSSIILLLSNSALAFNDNYSSTSTVYSSTQNGDQASGSSGTNYRYPFAECLSLGMPSSSLSSYCTTVSFPTDSKEFYGVFPSIEGVTRTPEDFNKILNSGAYTELESKYIKPYLGQQTPDWAIPTPDQLQTLVNLSKNGDLYKESKDTYNSGRFLTKTDKGEYVIAKIGNVAEDSPLKLPDIVSKNGLHGSNLSDVELPSNAVGKLTTKYTYVTTQDYSGRFDATFTLIPDEFKRENIDPTKVYFEVLYGKPGSDGIIRNPLKTTTPYYIDPRSPNYSYFIKSDRLHNKGDSSDNKYQIKLYTDPSKVSYLKALPIEFNCRSQFCEGVSD